MVNWLATTTFLVLQTLGRRNGKNASQLLSFSALAMTLFVSVSAVHAQYVPPGPPSYMNQKPFAITSPAQGATIAPGANFTITGTGTTMTTNKLVIISVTVKKKNGGMANQQFNTNIDAAGDWSKVISVTGVVLEDDDTVEVTAGHAPVGAIKQGKWTVKTPPPAPTP